MVYSEGWGLGALSFYWIIIRLEKGRGAVGAHVEAI